MADTSPPAADTTDFFFSGQGLSALLIHGLTGTPYEMRYIGERIAAAGMRVLGVRLAGHARTPEALGATTHANWYESVVAGFERLRSYDNPVVAVGLSMGALLAVRLAIEQPAGIAALVMLSPAFFLPRRMQLLLHLLRPLGREDLLYIHGSRGPDIHDAAARRAHPGARLMPLRAALNMLELSAYVRPKMRGLRQPTLLIHGRRDHVCPFDRNTRFLMKHLGSSNKRLVALDQSFHVITVDSERERVADEIITFIGGFRAAPRAECA
jgi:carboxylesterase